MEQSGEGRMIVVFEQTPLSEQLISVGRARARYSFSQTLDAAELGALVGREGVFFCCREDELRKVAIEREPVRWREVEEPEQQELLGPTPESEPEIPL